MERLANKQSEAAPHAKSAAAKSAGFKGLLAAQVASEKEKENKNEEVSPSSGSSDKKVEVITEEGIVKYIRVHCSCGEVTEIECQYSE